MDRLIAFGAALAFYGATLAPTLIWGDSAWLTLYAIRGMVGFETAAEHPLFLQVARLFLLLPGDPARNLALESAVFGALTVALVYHVSRQLGASRIAGFTAAGALAVSHAFWLHAVIPEVYTANAFFTLAAIALAFDWYERGGVWRCAAAWAVWAVGLTNHLVLAGLAPGLIVFAIVARPAVVFTGRTLLMALAAAALLIAVVLTVPSLSEAAYRLWVGPPGISDYFRPTFPVGAMFRETGFYLLYLVYQFPSVTLPLGLLGVFALLRDRPRHATLLLLAILVNAGVFIHHTAWVSTATAKFVFYISDYAIFALCCAAGVDEARRLLEATAARVFARYVAAAALVLAVVVPPAFYATLPAAAALYGVDFVQAKTLPYRDNQSYFLNPSKHGYRGARQFAEEAMRVVPPSSVIFADYTPATVLRYLQLVERVRPDVQLEVADGLGGDRVRVTWIDEDHHRPIFVASMTADYYDYSGLTGEYDFVPAGPIFEVRPRD